MRKFLSLSLSQVIHSVVFCFNMVINVFSANPTQSVEKTFPLSRADRDLLKDNQYDVQVCFILVMRK